MIDTTLVTIAINATLDIIWIALPPATLDALAYV